MKKSFLAVLFCLAFTALFAQKSSEEKATHAASKMAKNLDLTATQTSEVKTAYIEMYNAYSSLKSEEMEPQDKSKSRSTIRKSFDEKIASILTPDQNKKRAGKGKMNRPNGERQKNVKNKPVDMEERANKSAERTANQLSKQLNLSDQQKQQVYDAYKKKSLATQAIRPKMRTNRDEAVKERQVVNKEYKDTLDSILTDEQKQKRSSMRQNRMSRPQGSNGQSGMATGESSPMTAEKKIEGEYKEQTAFDRKAATQTKRMTDKIGLTKTQATSFHRVYLKRLKMIDGINKGDVADKPQAKKAVMDEYEASLANILTEEQLQKMDAMKYKKRHQ